MSEQDDDIERYEIPLRLSSGETHPAEVTLLDEGEDCTLELRFDGECLSATDEDFFDAFAQIRKVLWERGIVPLCYGASRDVFPSAMARSMGGGVKAYRRTLGAHSRLEDLVFIFDGGPDIEPVSPEEQEEFYDQWLASLGLRR